MLRTLIGSSIGRSFRSFSTSTAAYTSRYNDFELIQVSAPCNHVLHVELNRPEKRNALTREAFREIKTVFDEITDDQQCRAVVLSGTGKMFCAGIDYMDLMQSMGQVVAPPETTEPGQRDDVAGRSKFIKQLIALLQMPLTSIAKCPKPVIAAVHSNCIGAGVDMISAADIRYASTDAFFSIREVNIGMAADIGTLQRLPKIVGNDSLVREMAFTGGDFSADDALRLGLVSRVFPSQEETTNGAIELARRIASKSPVAVQGTKISLNYSRDHTVEEGLDFMQIWNMSMLQSEDLLVATTAVATKQESPEFPNL